MIETSLSPRPDATAIRAFRQQSSLRRERDIASALGISEAELMAADIGNGVRPIDPDPNILLAHAETFGTVMALTRNDSAVHEKIGAFEKITMGRHVSMTLGTDIDLRIFPRRWAYGFAADLAAESGRRRFLAYFDAAGDAVFKLHVRPDTDLGAFERFVDLAALAEPYPPVLSAPSVVPTGRPAVIETARLREAWLGLTDTHQFHGMLETLGIDRITALRQAGPDLSCPLCNDAVAALFDGAVASGTPIMVFVANQGTVQIHTGPVTTLSKMGPWLNVMDPDFHLHLRLDHIAETYLVRKPTHDGMITSVEACDADGRLIIQFFGLRKEGQSERTDWRALTATLPLAQGDAA